MEHINFDRAKKQPLKTTPKSNLDKFFSKEDSKLHEIKENPTFSSDEIKNVEKYPEFNHWELFLEKHKSKYPLIVKELSKLKPLTDEQFDLNIIKRKYISEKPILELDLEEVHIFLEKMELSILDIGIMVYNLLKEKFLIKIINKYLKKNIKME